MRFSLRFTLRPPRLAWLLLGLAWLPGLTPPAAAQAAPAPAAPASASAPSQLAVVDALLARVQPGQTTVYLDDMGFSVAQLRAYRARLAAQASGTRQPRSAFQNYFNKWTKGVVPYEFDANVTDEQKAEFVTATHDWEAVANIHFVPRSGQPNALHIQYSSTANNSYVGMIGGVQTVNLYNFNYEFIICHELGHALGMIHEQQRSNRDDFVTIHFENVDPNLAYNFNIAPDSLNHGPYDYDSVMHYARKDFSNNGMDTIVPKDASKIDTIGQRSHLSVLDEQGMTEVYGRFGEYFIGLRPDATVDQRYVDCYNRVNTQRADGNWLGLPVTGKVGNYIYTLNGGTGQNYLGGTSGPNSMYAKTGAANAYDLAADFAAKFRAALGVTGWATDDLGADFTASTGTTGATQPFETADLYRVTGTANAGVYEVHGPIRTQYNALNGPAGALGLPISDVTAAPESLTGTTGDQGLFETGGIYAGSGTVGQHMVQGAYYTKYAEAGKRWSGMTGSVLGFPTGEAAGGAQSPQGTPGGDQAFEAGQIASTTRYGTHAVYGDIFAQWSAQNELSGPLGFPVTDTYLVGGRLKQDFEGGTLTARVSSIARVLWTEPAGAASLLGVDPAGRQTRADYGPYPGWTARAVAQGQDDTLKMLWANADGRLALWTLDADSAQLGVSLYGPYPHWTAQSLAVGPDGKTRILWTNPNGQMCLWNVDAAGDFTYQTYGPFGGWTARQVTVDTNSTVRVLWTYLNGEISLWTGEAQPSPAHAEYGPFGGWTVKGFSAAANGHLRLLWNYTDAQASLWDLDGAGRYTYRNFGPFSGQAAAGVAVGSDGLTHLIWNTATPDLQLWSLDFLNPSAAPTITAYATPGPGFTAQAVTSGP